MIKKVMEDYKVLLRSIPAATVSLFFVSVIMMNLLANKELISLPYLALDCGFVVSWVSFLCQDMICKRFGAKASIKISILALAGQPRREPVLLGMFAHARHVGRLLRHGHDRGQHRP